MLQNHFLPIKLQQDISRSAAAQFYVWKIIVFHPSHFSSVHFSGFVLRTRNLAGSKWRRKNSFDFSVSNWSTQFPCMSGKNILTTSNRHSRLVWANWCLPEMLSEKNNLRENVSMKNYFYENIFYKAVKFFEILASKVSSAFFLVPEAKKWLCSGS